MPPLIDVARDLPAEQIFPQDCEVDHTPPARIRCILGYTGWREPISISGAGKVVDGILRRRPCSFWVPESSRLRAARVPLTEVMLRCLHPRLAAPGPLRKSGLAHL